MFLSACGGNDNGGDNVTPDNSTTFEEKQLVDDKGNVTETIVTVTDNGEGVGNKTFSADKTWVLNGLVFVNSGQTLTIEAGTLIKGKSGQGENASALVVAQGGKIMAEGTASAPIIMTAEADNLEGNLPPTARGLWGGLILLGKAKLNSSPGTSAIEGIPTSEPRGLYGGDDDADNSGVVKYVSIRHGGTDIGAGNEINGITLGGVGSGTVLEHIEVIANNDDGVESFGGTPQMKWFCSIFNGDDAIDYDEGYRGKGQFYFAYQDSKGDRGGEHDGGTDPEDGTPYATPHFENNTYMGNGTSRLVTFRDNAGGTYNNCVMVNYGKGVDIEDLADGEDSRKRFEAGDLHYNNNIHWNVAGNDMAKQVITAASTSDDLLSATTGNQVVDPELTGCVPSASGPASTATGVSGDSFFDNVSYKGAFEPGQTPWWDGWTLTSEASVVQ